MKDWSRTLEHVSSHLNTPLESMKYVTLASVKPNNPLPTPYSVRNSPAESLRTGYCENFLVNQEQETAH